MPHITRRCSWEGGNATYVALSKKETNPFLALIPFRFPTAQLSQTKSEGSALSFDETTLLFSVLTAGDSKNDAIALKFI